MFLDRLVAFLWVTAFAAAAVLLLLSDRGGDIFTTVLDVIMSAGRRVESESGVNLIDRDDIPGEADQIVHAFFWGSGMLLIGWVARNRIPILITGLIVGSISLAFELAQPVLSSTRAIEASDAVANLVGVAFASAVLFVSMVIIRRLYGDDRTYVQGPNRPPPRDDTTDELFLQF